MKEPVPFRLYNIVAYGGFFGSYGKVGTITALESVQCTVQDAVSGFRETFGYLDICGVKLNERWVQNAGFTEPEPGTFQSACGRVIFWKDSDGYTLATDLCRPVAFTTVHQLQNTFFALTGEELMFKNVT